MKILWVKAGAGSSGQRDKIPNPVSTPSRFSASRLLDGRRRSLLKSNGSSEGEVVKRTSPNACHACLPAAEKEKDL